MRSRVKAGNMALMDVLHREARLTKLLKLTDEELLAVLEVVLSKCTPPVESSVLVELALATQQGSKSKTKQV